MHLLRRPCEDCREESQDFHLPSMTPTDKRKQRRVNVACVICRNQHLKCDAKMPRCSRCQEYDKRCIYKDIRRPSRRQAPNTSYTPDHGSDATSQPIAIPVTPTSLTSDPNRHMDFQETPFILSEDAATPESTLFDIAEHPNPHSSRAIDGFYAHFFKGHPFVLPRPRLLSRFDDDPDSMTGLIRAMAFIGSLYILDVRSSLHRRELERVIANGLPRTGFSAQCLLLFAGALEWSGEQDKARSVLNDAKTAALAMGMHNQSFASKYGEGCPVMEESWRRTWWELYVIDGIFAGIRHQPTFSLWQVDCDTDLPCEEMQYSELIIPTPKTLVDYDNRAFEDGDNSFSSFTYLIDAARILGTTLSTVDRDDDEAMPLVKNAEANIMSWHLYLPKTKAEPVLPSGEVDEVMFRAHMLLDTLTTHLHRPRSRLNYSLMELLCSKYAPPEPSRALFLGNQHNERHTFQAIKASAAWVELLTLSSSPLTHSPFIMCMGSMAVAAHMSACEFHLKGPKYKQAKDRVSVFLGVLKAFEHIWPQASKWSNEVKLMAKAVFGSRDKSGDLIFSSSFSTPTVVEEGMNQASQPLGQDLQLLRSCFENIQDEGV